MRAVVLDQTATTDIGAHSAKERTFTPGQTDVSMDAWVSGDVRAGLWEVSEGHFDSVREGYHEVCQILSGHATITEPDGREFEIREGSLFVTPNGWTGTWTIHEPLRKMWVYIPVAS